jgi:hypothetical protein
MRRLWGWKSEFRQAESRGLSRRCPPETIRRGWAKDLNSYIELTVRVEILQAGKKAPAPQDYKNG